jgi:hypothetical protein
MAFPHPPGLTPPEIAFICEMELVTIVPRQRLERLDLLGVSGPAPGLYANERWEHTQKESTQVLILSSAGSHSGTYSAPTISPASVASPPPKAPTKGEHYSAAMAAS